MDCCRNNPRRCSCAFACPAEAGRRRAKRRAAAPACGFRRFAEAPLQLLKRSGLTFLLAILALAAGPAGGQVIKLGTVAPEGSPWHTALLEIAQEWGKLSGGRVQVRIYPGGVAGDESDMLRKIRIGQLHAAALTGVGLVDIAPDIEALFFPTVAETDGELDYLIETLGHIWERQMQEKGFEVLTWSSAGWVHFFSKAPVVTPDDLRKRKIVFWGSNALYVELLQKSGFQPVPLAVTDILPSLQTGLVDTFAAPPAAALSFQWFALALNMTDFRWQPLPAATVISKKKWDEIPAELQPRLKDAATKIGRRLHEKIRTLESDAINAMKHHGLKVISVPPDVEKQWGKLVREQGLPVFVGRRFSQERFDEVQKALSDFRAQSTATTNTAP